MRHSSVKLVQLAVEVGHKSEKQNDKQALLKALTPGIIKHLNTQLNTMVEKCINT